MPRRIVFATGNKHKVEEVSAILGTSIELVGLKDIGCLEDIPETQPTIVGNAIQKAEYIRDNYQMDCFSEDTGLEIEALDGEPGVRSARYAGEDKDSEANMNLVLERLSQKENRKARFKTVIALILDGKTTTFEGIVNGTILSERQGEKGFGYDPIFQPEGYEQSFAEMGAEEKNKISHRAIAVNKLIRFLQRSTGI